VARRQPNESLQLSPLSGGVSKEGQGDHQKDERYIPLPYHSRYKFETYPEFKNPPL